MEPESSLTYLQVFTPNPYPEPNESGSQNPTLFFKVYLILSYLLLGLSGSLFPYGL
jgi:hypothetical protein